MGALAPVSASWIPEDDFLLKNAVESGASLESLAKGAVQFSQRFTIRELQERWHSLLYDPVVSAEAAFHMIEYDCSIPALSAKFCRSGNLNKCTIGKRKAESVRNCYYAHRKRIRNEPFNSLDLSFLVGPDDGNFVGTKYDPLSSHYGLKNSVINHFELQENVFDCLDGGFQQIEDGSFHAQFQSTVCQDYPLGEDNVHDKHHSVSHLVGENLSHPGNKISVRNFAELKELHVHGDPMNGCSKYDGNQVFSSPIPELTASFHNLDYSSPLPEMPLWGSNEGDSEPCITMDLGKKDMEAGNTFSIHGDVDLLNAHSSAHDILCRDPNIKLEMPSEELNDETGNTEWNLAELSNTLLDFTTEEDLLFMDIDGKEVIDKSYYDGLSSLLLNSPNDTQGHMDDLVQAETSEIPVFPANHSSACPAELDQSRGSQHIDSIVQEVPFPPSISDSDTQFPELSDGVICCTLNTEDPEIPCNDDIIFTNHPRSQSVSSIVRRNVQDASKSNVASAKEVSCNQQIGGGPELQKKVPENHGQSNVSQMMRLQTASEINLLHPVNDLGAKFEWPSSKSACTGAGKVNDISIQVCSANAVPTNLIGETTERALMRQQNHNSVNSVECHPQVSACGIEEEPGAAARLQNHHNATSSEQLVNDSISDPEEQSLGIDDDIPYYSDVEAMILDMDLDPEDQDLHSCEQVLRYQHEETKRVIMRLEQSAHSYLERDITSHGAFAVLYGRHSRHYITKPEVLLGRATEDIVVDIDLGREGPANKISRRQATIYLDDSGSFQIKNLGKCSIFVNDKEAAPGQILTLSSGCLIEIRGMPFVFESSQKGVTRYLDNATRKGQKV